MRALVIVWIALASCSSPADVPPLGDYTSWKRVDTYGNTPGHGDTYRIIYANDMARMFAGGRYGAGTVLVKEIHANDHDMPGPLQVIEIMRRIGPSESVTGLDDQGGWVFTTTDQPGGREVLKTTCWRRCHVASPYAGAWLSYGD